ncbi:MAG: hypothetical protein AB1728_04685 [Bacteroidota bacterium]
MKKIPSKNGKGTEWSEKVMTNLKCGMKGILWNAEEFHIDSSTLLGVPHFKENRRIY